MPLIQDAAGKYRAKGAIAPDEILELAARITEARVLNEGVALTDPSSSERLFATRLRHLDAEEFHVAFLTSRHCVISIETLFRGTIDGAEVHPREVARAALRHNAAALIVAHNHPSGSAEPSAADRAVTARLKQALALIDVRLLDHIVVGNPGCTSLASRGWV